MEINLSKAGMLGRVEHIDSKTPSPKDRAMHLYAQLSPLSPTYWDLVCLAGELLGLSALVEPQLQSHARELLKFIYDAHYIHGTQFDSCKSLTNANSQITPSLLTGHKE